MSGSCRAVQHPQDSGSRRKGCACYQADERIRMSESSPTHENVSMAEGVRDGAAARAAHDYLRAHRQGKVSATLNIVSVDLATRTIVVARNSHCPVIVVTPEEGMKLLDEPVGPIGTRRGTKPSITELPLKAGTVAVVYTDGLERAGARSSLVFNVPDALREITSQGWATAERIADDLLERALTLENGRPRDDISVLVLRVTERLLSVAETLPPLYVWR